MEKNQERHKLRNRWTLIIMAICSGLVLVGITLTQVRRSQAVTAQLGCPQQLTVRTGQDFYITVVISDVYDLYAWQSDLSYNTSYLSYQGWVASNFLTPGTTSQYVLDPVLSSGLVDNIAITRLQEDTGVNGSGKLFYAFFTALQDTGTGYTNAKLENSQLVERNALEIDRTMINSSNCRVYIDDNAPYLEQPPVGETTVYLPVVLR